MKAMQAIVQRATGKLQVQADEGGIERSPRARGTRALRCVSCACTDYAQCVRMGGDACDCQGSS